MKLLNLCCGSVRPQGEEWVNLDNLHAVLAPASPEAFNLCEEKNYINWNIEKEGFCLPPFGEKTFDGILASHCIEHWTAPEAASLMCSCHATLKPGGALIVSVPDAQVFRSLQPQDNLQNAVRLFGEPIFEGDGEDTFAGYALWNRFHKAILCEDSLWAYFLRAGFEPGKITHMQDYMQGFLEYTEAIKAMAALLNRLKFSLIMVGTK